MTKKQRTYNGRKGSLFFKWYWESWTAICKTMKLDHSFIPHKINLEWINLKVRAEITIPLEENIHHMFLDISLSNIFLDVST